jgi:hypothetical protein
MSTEGLLIVVELGAEWPSFAGVESSKPASSRRVIAQDEAESPAAFAVRASEQLNGLQARGVALGTAVIACSERTDPQAQAARADLAGTVASALARGRGGSLWLSAVDRNEGRSRPSLTALHGELAKAWQSAGIDVKLRFGHETLGESHADPKSRTNSKRSGSKDVARRVA